jgi:hypothetical protein
MSDYGESDDSVFGEQQRSRCFCSDSERRARPPLEGPDADVAERRVRAVEQPGDQTEGEDLARREMSLCVPTVHRCLHRCFSSSS